MPQFPSDRPQTSFYLSGIGLVLGTPANIIGAIGNAFVEAEVEIYFWPGTGDLYEHGYMGTGLGQTNSGAITFVYLDYSSDFDETASSDLVSVSDKISEIRSSLTLNITQTAEILKVRRPTIYSWLREQSVMRSRNTYRLDLVYLIAQMWKKLSDAPIGNGIYLALNDQGDTLIRLLAQESINVGSVKSALASISSKTSESPRPSLDPKLLLASMGIEEQNIIMQRETIDDLSGKRPSSSED